MKKFPEGILGTITMALAFDLHQRYRTTHPSHFSGTELAVDIVKAVKWVHAEDPDLADAIVGHAFQLASDLKPRPVPFAVSADCVATSLAQQSSHPYGQWSRDQSREFVERCLNRS
ncbi:hypothetical protein ACQRET_03210 [Streptomyces koyangensis]|uniref:hypothetical protein n=1 Tax=Streptomyces koyangensis TaxID=188770 RepID=UPI003D09123D